MKYLIIISVLFFNLNAQTLFEFLPDSLHFYPLRGGNDEARMGLVFYPENLNLKVQIGNSTDVLSFAFDGYKKKITVGAEFMAYGSVRTYKDYILQIDAIDGMFGGNISYSNLMDDGRFFIRFRFIHHSAHLVDGHWDSEVGNWIERIPNSFGKDFAEIIFSNEKNYKDNLLRYYGGGNFAVHINTQNKILKRYVAKAGFEIVQKNIFGKVFNKDGNGFLLYNIHTMTTETTMLNHHIQLGYKFGYWYDKGISFYLAYYNGSNPFSQYFENRVENFGIGFNIDFY